ncbi:superoxide dismutase [Gloeothece verrucosa]|uniref:Superoxide dismutase n=1 Tax=Gloeothece verrucosa (strain PCC 7822) TaxID=497965 RepID=E0UD98_GLOV7|nr:superoxide dismutase [Gloeothece verrucosa]ADN14089.1 Manganese/iron superoxide dismutase-like protein [Gloeothece verrucosa PCC 7822]
MTINRRNFLYLLGAGAGATALGMFPGQTIAQTMAQTSGSDEPFTLPPLPYAYNALEPYIDQETMRFHHDKHHAAYTKNLNGAVNKYPQLKGKSAEDLIKNINSLPQDIQTTVRNNGGGYVNHDMFWKIMSPNAGGKPKGEIAKAINQDFGSFEAFQAAFNKAGESRFGSGWAWLILDKNGKLKVSSTANQDSPLMEGIYPIMGNDVWEHAYYLKYKNNRGQYLQQWWNVVNWDEVNKRFQQAKS